METLADDPRSPAVGQVARELLRRRRWEEAETLLARVAQHDEALGSLLAEARYELGRYDGALNTLESLDTRPAQNLRNARMMVLCLERVGRIAEAREGARAYLRVDPADVAISAVLERITAPMPEGGQHGADPFFTVERAERYALSGRVDKAIRAYRRILLYHPGDVGLTSRLGALSREAAQPADDLSEELDDPSLLPPEPLDMPEPGIVSTPLGLDFPVKG